VHVPAAARQVLVPLGHEAGNDAEAGADLLGAGLEQQRAVGASSAAENWIAAS